VLLLLVECHTAPLLAECHTVLPEAHQWYNNKLQLLMVHPRRCPCKCKCPLPRWYKLQQLLHRLFLPVLDVRYNCTIIMGSFCAEEFISPTATIIPIMDSISHLIGSLKSILGLMTRSVFVVQTESFCVMMVVHPSAQCTVHLITTVCHGTWTCSQVFLARMLFSGHMVVIT